MNFRVRTVTVMMAIGELKGSYSISSMTYGWARMPVSDLQFQSPVFHYFRRKVRIHRRSFVLGCSRSSSVVDRRVTGKTVTL